MRMGDIFKSVAAFFVILFVIYVAGFFATGGNLAIYKYWAPQMEDARREVFENTQSYVQGKNTYLSRLRLQYETAEGKQKDALRRIILSEAETIDLEHLTPANSAFVNSLR